MEMAVIRMWFLSTSETGSTVEASLSRENSIIRLSNPLIYHSLPRMENPSSRLLELGGESSGIGNAEVVQRDPHRDEMIFQDFVTLGKWGQQDFRPSLLMLIDPSWRGISRVQPVRKPERMQHPVQLAVGHVGPVHGKTPRTGPCVAHLRARTWQSPVGS